MKTFFCMILVAVALIGAGCRQDGAPEADTATSNIEADSGTVTSQTAVEAGFIDTMVPHHQMGIHMVDLVLQNGSRPDVKTFAQNLKNKQQSEIDRMQTIRKALSGEVTSDTSMVMDDAMRVSMDSLHAARGEDLDRMFLSHMIPHHRQAIQMTREHLPGIQHAGLQEMMRTMIADQEREVGEMQQMLEK